MRRIIAMTATGLLALAGCVSDGHRTIPTAVLQEGLPAEYREAAADNARFQRGVGDTTPDGEATADGEAGDGFSSREAIGPNAPATVLGGQVTLAACLRSALASNESIASSAEDYVQALLGEDEAIAASRPDISAKATHYREEDVSSGGGDFGGGGSDFSQRSSLAISAEVPVWHGFRQLHALRGRQALSRSQAQSMVDRRNQLALTVTEAYYTALQADRSVAIAMSAVTLNDERLATVQKLVDAGAARKGELLTTRASLAQARAELERAHESLRLARERLGYAAGARITGDLATPTEPTRAALALDPLLDRALTRRPDLLALQELLTSRVEQIEFVKRERYPDVDLSANVYPYRDGSSEDVRWDVTLSAEVPIYRSGRWITTLRIAESQERQARLAIQEQRRRIDLDLREAVTEIQSSDSLLRALAEQVAATEEAYRQVKREFDAGAASNLEVTAAQTQLLASQLDRDTESLRNAFLYRRLWTLTGDFLAADLESGVTR